MIIANHVRRVKQSIESDRAREIENDRMALDRAAKRISLADLSVDDLAAVIGDVIKNQRREILKHVQRLLTLAEVKQRDPHEKIVLTASRGVSLRSSLNSGWSEKIEVDKKRGAIARISCSKIVL